MLQELLSWLPQDASRAWLTAGLVCATAGLVLWGVGARVGRSAFTLVGVAAGAWIGLRVPRWIGSEVEPMGLACAAALVLGLAGYLLHAVWVGLMLGTLFGAAGVLLAWNKLAGDAAWSMPLLDLTAPVEQILRELWASLPGALPRVMPYVAVGCFAAGVLITVIWPKLGRVLAFSVLGTVLFAAGGVVAIRFVRPEWLAYFPASGAAQAMGLSVLAAAGAAVQWLMYPRASRPVNVQSPAPPPPPARRRDALRKRDVTIEVAAAVRGANVGGMKLTEARA